MDCHNVIVCHIGTILLLITSEKYVLKTIRLVIPALEIILSFIPAQAGIQISHCY